MFAWEVDLVRHADPEIPGHTSIMECGVDWKTILAINPRLQGPNGHDLGSVEWVDTLTRNVGMVPGKR